MTEVVIRRSVLVDGLGQVLSNTPLTEAIESQVVSFEVGVNTYTPPRYLVYLYNHDLELQSIFDLPALLSLNFEVELSTVTPCVFSIPATDARAALIERDWFAEIWRFNGELWLSQCTYMIKLIERIREQSENAETIETFVFGGLSLEDLLAGRIVDPNDDPNEAGGYSTKSGFAESVMHEYVKEQVGEYASAIRQVPNFTQSYNYNRGRVTGYRERHSVLLELLRRMTEPFGIDFRVLLLNQHITFTTDVFGINQSKSADSSSFFVFSERRGNLANAKISRDYRETKNYAYILGPGEGENRTILNASTSDAILTPYSRREFVVDAGNTEAGSSLEALTEGEQELNDQKPHVEFTFDLVQNNISRYDIHWRLGDIVTVIFQDFEQDLRVMKIAVSIDQTVENITPTLRELIL